METWNHKNADFIGFFAVDYTKLNRLKSNPHDSKSSDVYPIIDSIAAVRSIPVLSGHVFR
jgi:hypothetical protein